MLQLHCTKKLLTKLSPDSEGLLPEGRKITNANSNFLGPNPISGWHANLITIQRRNCILMVHNTTRFPLLMIGLVKKDYPKLDYLFTDALMNQMKSDLEHLIWYDNVKVEDLSPYRTANWLADRPCTVKGQKDCIWPKDAMLNLLNQIATGLPKLDKPNFEQVNFSDANIVSIKDYQ